MGLSIFSIGMSGMSAALSRVNVASDNIARENVIGAEARRVVPQADAFGGVTAKIETVEMSDSQKAQLDEYNPSNINLANEFLQQDLGLHSFQANAYVVNKSLDLLGLVLDIKI